MNEPISRLLTGYRRDDVHSWVCPEHTARSVPVGVSDEVKTRPKEALQ